MKLPETLEQASELLNAVRNDPEGQARLFTSIATELGRRTAEWARSLMANGLSPREAIRQAYRESGAAAFLAGQLQAQFHAGDLVAYAVANQALERAMDSGFTGDFDALLFQTARDRGLALRLIQ